LSSVVDIVQCAGGQVNSHYFIAQKKELKGSVKEPNMFHNYETEKITRKASDAAEYIKLFGFSPEIVMHDAFNVIH